MYAKDLLAFSATGVYRHYHRAVCGWKLWKVCNDLIWTRLILTPDVQLHHTQHNT